jgi:serine/threonine protein kinase
MYPRITGSPGKDINITFTTDFWEQFEKIRQLGSPGKYGSVFEVREIKTGIHYAVKIVDVHGPNGTDFLKVREAVLEFNYHRRALTDPGSDQLDKHFIQVYDCALILGDNASFVFILMEKADITLLDAVKSKSVTRKHLCAWASFILTGIRIMHKKGLVHRDLHELNILFVGNRPVIADFGISCFNDVCVNRIMDSDSSMVLETFHDVKTFILTLLRIEKEASHHHGFSLFSEKMRSKLDRLRKRIDKNASYLKDYSDIRKRNIFMKRDNEFSFAELNEMMDLDKIVDKVQSLCRKG